MDKYYIMDDKKIEVNQSLQLHRLIAGMPEAAREYGLWIINGSIGLSCRTQVDIKKDHDRRFEFYSLSQLVRGKGVLRLGSRIVDVVPGDAILICPGDWNLYGGTNGSEYCEDAIRFCGKLPDFMRKQGIIRSGLIHLGNVRKLVPLIEQARELSTYGWLNAALNLQQLLMELFSDQKISPMESLLKTIAKSPDNHWWSVAELAELRGISLERLRREFLKNTGLLPKNYLEHSKLNKAAEFMITSGASVTETALHFGYMDRYHFSRRFKHLFGVSPDQYRKLFTLNDDTPRH